MSHSFIIAGCRTPIGRFMGGLSSVPATRLGSHVIRESVRRSGLSAEQVDEVTMGQVLTCGAGQAPARQAALEAGIPESTPALTVNKVCGSGLKAVMLADQAIRAGDASVIVAGGMENMSRAPFFLSGARQGYRIGDQTLVDSMLSDGLTCAIEHVGMGALAERTAEIHLVSRADQDSFATESHRRAVLASSGGHFADEILSIQVQVGRSEQRVSNDEGPRAETGIDTLGKLKPAFAENGSVTAGNASQISDGAASVVVVNESIAGNTPSKIKARIVASATAGLAPRDVFVAPVAAMQRVLSKARLTVEEIDLFEINEAFAAMCLACIRPLQIPLEKVNVNGGAISLGHPIGASGARTLVTLLHALAARDGRLGLVSLCLGGGNAVAMIVERI